MENEEKKFDIVPAFDEESGMYVIKDFELGKSFVELFIKERTENVEITNNVIFGDVKKSRTEIRKRLDSVTKARIKINDMILGQFNTQLKEIETMLKVADNTLKAKVDAYEKEVKGGNGRPKINTLTIKSYDSKAIEEIEKFAKQFESVSVERK